MKLPASNIQSAPRRCLQLLTPVNLHFRCGIPLREKNDSWSRVHLVFQKSSHQVSVSANSTHEVSYNDFESHGPGKKGNIHFIGVGGCGLSALAILALKQGYTVSGSDIAWSSYMDALKEAGASLYVGHSERNLQRNGNKSSFPDAVVVSSAIPPENVEVMIAKTRGVPVYKRGAWLGKITKDYNLIAVSGSHGSFVFAAI